MIKKQTVIIAVLCAVFIGLLVAYFAVVKPLTEAEETQTEPPAVETDEGESVGMGIGKILVYEYVKNEDIQTITVTNEYGEYTVYRDEEGSPQIKGFEGVSFHKETMASLMTSIGYPLAITKIEDPNELSEYGLAEVTLEDGSVKRPASFEFTTKDGKSFRGLVGDKIVTGNGYYFLYEKRPDVVYVLDLTIAGTVLAPVEALVDPMIVTPLTENDYFLVHDYILMKGDDTILSFDYIEESERADTENVTKTYRMLSHDYLYPSDEAIADAMYGLFTSVNDGILETVKLGFDEQDLEKYNLTGNCYSLYYKHNGLENFILISPRSADGTYYVASPLFRQIVKGGDDTFGFVRRDLFDWVEPSFFQMKIGFISDITVAAGDFSVTYDLRGEGQNLTVTERGTGKKPDVTNFRQFYKTLLYASYEGESALTSDELAIYRSMPDSEAQVVLTINTEAGTELKYRFFRYSERRSFVDFGERGQFYCLSTMAEKILADAKRVQSGEEINSTGKY